MCVLYVSLGLMYDPEPLGALPWYGCVYVFAALVPVCIYVMVTSSAYAMT